MSLWSKHAVFEKNSIILLIGILIAVSIGGLVLIVPIVVALLHTQRYLDLARRDGAILIRE